MMVAGLACSSNLCACGAHHPHRKFRDFDRTVYPEIFRMILDHGVSPNLVGRFGYRLAHHMAACGVVWGEVIMTEAERVAFATILLDYGADLNVLDDLLQSSPLGWAVRWGKYDLARLYLERGRRSHTGGCRLGNAARLGREKRIWGYCRSHQTVSVKMDIIQNAIGNALRWRFLFVPCWSEG